LDVAAAQPGIFEINQQAAIYDANGNLIGPWNPAHAGDTIAIYCAGLGAVAAQPADGVAAADGSSTGVSTVTVNIGGIALPATSAGLLLETVGVYGIAVVVPQGIPTGDSVPMNVIVAGQVNR
jgi:uncharacterized protein (TIGR03437 family)